ncbi:DUF2267 domain-containing protein [Saccharopolyspora sp. NPDC000995]
MASTWAHDVGHEFDTDDHHFAYRVLRAWLHVLRERLPVETAAHFAEQLPELLRGVYYGGWNPSTGPEKYDVQQYLSRFAREANISVADVHRAAPAITAVALRRTGRQGARSAPGRRPRTAAPGGLKPADGLDWSCDGCSTTSFSGCSGRRAGQR